MPKRLMEVFAPIDYRLCSHCQKLFPIHTSPIRTRKNKKTCSNACRVALSRMKRKVEQQHVH